MINILIVDDSTTETLLLKSLFNAESDMQVIGCAKNGKEAVEMALKLKPDLITMDICMPVMDGIEAIRHIMIQQNTPIVVISSKLNDTILNATFEALEAGALSVLDKPTDITSTQFKKLSKNMIDTVRSMAEIKVIKRRHFAQKDHIKNVSPKPSSHQYEILGIGTSVGGPQALTEIFSKLNADFPIPIVVVQHMTTGFIKGFSDWINKRSKLKAKEIQDKEILEKGHIYFAPDHHHLVIEKAHEKLRGHLIKGSPVSGFCPSATILLQSLAKVSGNKAIGVLLTGMGEDGAQGLLEIKKVHGHTLIQDSDSAIVFGMAKVALSLGAVDKIIKLNEMADYLMAITQPSAKSIGLNS